MCTSIALLQGGGYFGRNLDLEYSFGEIEIVKVPGLEGEFGIVTPVMMEGDYDTRANRYKDQILHMIRIEDQKA